MKSKYLILGILVLMFVLQSCDSTQNDWKTAKKVNTVESYSKFLEKHPQSDFNKDAQIKIDSLKHSILINKEWSESVKKIPIIIGSGWGVIILGTTKEKVDSFLLDKGTITNKYEDCYFVDYLKCSIQINYSLSDSVSAIFFYNKDIDHENMTGFPIKTKENIGWSSTPFDVKEAYGQPLETIEGTNDNILWQRLVYKGADFRFLEKKLVRISITKYL
jgi:hypothetical protein